MSVQPSNVVAARAPGESDLTAKLVQYTHATEDLHAELRAHAKQLGGADSTEGRRLLEVVKNHQAAHAAFENDAKARVGPIGH